MDQNTSLPIRTESAGDVIVKLGDGTIPSQQLGIDSTGRIVSKLQDSSGNALAAVATALKVAVQDSSGTAISYANPLPVTVTDPSGTERNEYNTVSALAAAATSNHDYTVPASKTLYLNQVIAAASGKAKFELQVETGAATSVFTTKAVLFNSTAEPNVVFEIKNPLVLAAGVRARLVRTNKDQQAQDIYSTLCGYEI